MTHVPTVQTLDFLVAYVIDPVRKSMPTFEGRRRSRSRRRRPVISIQVVHRELDDPAVGTLCPHCGHSDGLHTGPVRDGRGADGGSLSVDYECGRCGQATLNDDGSSTSCACPGWYPGLTVMQLAAETIAGRASCNQFADPPAFRLRAPVGKRRSVQMKLF